MRLDAVDPRVKLFILAALSTCAVTFRQPEKLFGMAAACFLILILGGVPWRKVKRQLKAVGAMVVPLFLMQCVFNRAGEGAIFIAGVPIVTWGGLRAGFNLAGRMLVILLSALILLTGRPRDYLLALLQWRMPYELAFMVMAAMRFLPLLREEAQNIFAAVQMRGARVKGAKLSEKLKIYLSILLPVTAGALRRAEQMSVAMEARGFRSRPERTRMRALVMNRKDWAWLYGTAAFALFIALA